MIEKTFMALGAHLIKKILLLNRKMNYYLHEYFKTEEYTAGRFEESRECSDFASSC